MSVPLPVLARWRIRIALWILVARIAGRLGVACLGFVWFCAKMRLRPREVARRIRLHEITGRWST